MKPSSLTRIRRDALETNHRASQGKLTESDLKRELIKTTKNLADICLELEDMIHANEVKRGFRAQKRSDQERHE